MTYEELDGLRKSDGEEAELAEELTGLIEDTLQKYPFRNRPRSVRFLGAGYGCIEVFCCNGEFTVLRNNGNEPQIIMKSDCRDGLEKAYRALVSLIYAGRKPEDIEEIISSCYR